MNRRVVFLGVLAFLLGCAGGGTSNKSPDQMTKAEFEAWLSTELKMTDLSVTENGQGQFTGTGKKDGKTYQIKVTREARKASWEIKYEGPGEGETTNGSRAW